MANPGIPFALRTQTPEDIADFVNNNFREIFEERIGGKTLEETDDRYAPISGSVAQIVHYQTGEVATGTTNIPTDDTIPQNDEGDEYMSLAITPKEASNILIIDVSMMCGVSAVVHLSAALFQNTDVNSLASAVHVIAGANYAIRISLRHKMTAGTTNQILFKVRAGPNGSATVTFNGSGGGRIFGGTYSSYITITEYNA